MFGRPIKCALFVSGLLILGMVPAAIQAQEPPAFPPVPILLGNTEDRSLESAIVGDTYRLSVALPLSYFTATGRTYPVLYVLDPHLSFGTVTDVVRVAAIGGELPELIVVGVGYPGDLMRARALRERDYHSTPDVFLRFFLEELIPLIDGDYRTNPADRGIVGHSYGGDFALYALFHSPETFQRIIAGSPTFATAGVYERAYAADHTTLAARVFLSAGENDDPGSSPARLADFAQTLESRGYADLALTSQVFDGATHFASRPLHHVTGVYAVYGR